MKDLYWQEELGILMIVSILILEEIEHNKTVVNQLKVKCNSNLIMKKGLGKDNS